MTLGFADLHCHPMVHLGFGGEVRGRSFFSGRPEGDPPVALKSCCADHLPRLELRSLVPWATEFRACHGGFELFPVWPDPKAKIHQQMYLEQVRRAHGAGLRLIVACAVNNELLADAYHGCRPGNSDEAAIDRQLTAIAQWVDQNWTWMALVRSPWEARAAVEQEKLAVVMGIEVDSIAGATMRREGQLSPADAQKIVDRWWARGVRLIHPVHLADNALGGAALYDARFNCLIHYLNQKHASGLTRPWYGDAVPASANGPDRDVRFLLSSADQLLTWAYGVVKKDPYPDYAQLCGSVGHVNRRGLSEAGEAFVRRMMRRGMLVDVEHMSARSFRDTLSIARAERYPVFSTHTLLRDLAVKRSPEEPFRRGCATEAMRSREDLLLLKEVGGYLGLGAHAGLAAEGADRIEGSANWAAAFRYAVSEIGFDTVAIGTDMNGFAEAPGARFRRGLSGLEPRRREDRVRPLVYGSDPLPTGNGTLERARLGIREYDLNVDGVCHYGMLPDLLLDVALSIGDGAYPSFRSLDPLLHSADGFIRVWQRCEDRAPTVREW